MQRRTSLEPPLSRPGSRAQNSIIHDQSPPEAGTEFSPVLRQASPKLTRRQALCLVSISLECAGSKISTTKFAGGTPAEQLANGYSIQGPNSCAHFCLRARDRHPIALGASSGTLSRAEQEEDVVDVARMAGAGKAAAKPLPVL